MNYLIQAVVLMQGKGQLSKIKSAENQISPAMKTTIAMSSEYCFPQVSPPEFGNVKMKTFHNDYPYFQDTNNLSLVSFFEYGNTGVVILYPGDIEKSGWEKLLENTEFLSYLRRVNIFIASHHGRENGYNERVFDYCQPDVFVISDKSITYTTQQNSYAMHAKGIPFNQTETRKVLTTRNDGMITIDVHSNGTYQIHIP